MGSDPERFFANLFQHYYENRWIRQLRKSDIRRGRRFANVVQIIDDLTTIDDDGEFERSCKEIFHPPEFELKMENVDYSEVSFVDLGIKIVHKNLIFSFMIKEMISHFQKSECHILLVTNPENVLFRIWIKDTSNNSNHQ